MLILKFISIRCLKVYDIISPSLVLPPLHRNAKIHCWNHIFPLLLQRCLVFIIFASTAAAVMMHIFCSHSLFFRNFTGTIDHCKYCPAFKFFFFFMLLGFCIIDYTTHFIFTIQIFIQELLSYGSYSQFYGSFLTLESKPFSSAFSISGFFYSNRFGGSLFLVSLSQLPLSAWVNYLIMYCCVVLM